MKKNLVIAVIVASAVLISGRAFAVSQNNWNADGTWGFQTTGGLQLPVGDKVYLVVLQSGRTEANVIADFASGVANVFATDLKIYGSGAAGDGTGSAGTFEESNTSSDNTFLGLQLYFVAINATTTGGANQMAMVTATGNPQWTTADINAVPPTNIRSQLLDEQNHIVLGSLGTAQSGNDWGYANAINLAQVVPEPSSIMLVGFGLIGLVGLARRRS